MYRVLPWYYYLIGVWTLGYARMSGIMNFSTSAASAQGSVPTVLAAHTETVDQNANIDHSKSTSK